MSLWLPRHQAMVERLLAVLEADRLPHALLFRGPEGVGKREVAKRFARTALQRRTRAADMFGGGGGGVINLEREHPDLVVIKPDDGIIRTEQVKELPKALSYAPLESELRFVILEEAEKLNTQAANAILKILEEPPAHTHFILIARDRAVLLPTIASRCQDIRFSPLSAEELRELGAEANTLTASEGSFSRSEELLRRQESQLWDEPAQLLLDLWQTQKIPPASFALFERLESEADALAVIESWQALGRDIALALQGVATTAYHPRLMTSEWVTNLSDERRSRLQEALTSLASVCDQARQQLFFNVNARLVLESLLAQLARLA